MRILIITQKMDKDDPVLGFFHRWVAEFSKKFESIVVICLEKGSIDLPKNVHVFSLGKEEGKSRLKYIRLFYSYIFREKKNYDAVFVHMNQEYILLGGIFWKIFGKKIYMWRNHHAGSFLTDIAASFCTNVFCTSKFSFTAKYKKTILMPVGVDTDFFKPNVSVKRVSRSILFLARMARVKKPDVLLSVLATLAEKKEPFTASFYGDPLPKDSSYYVELQAFAYRNNLSEHVSFHAGVPNDKTPEIYSTHNIFVNLSSSGMYDKTIFEAMACGSLVLASNKNLYGLIDDHFIFEEGNEAELETKLVALLNEPAEKMTYSGKTLRETVIKNHRLSKLAARLSEIIRR